MTKNAPTPIPVTLRPRMEIQSADMEAAILENFGFNVCIDREHHGNKIGQEFVVDPTMIESPTWADRIKGVQNGQRSNNIFLLLASLVDSGLLAYGTYVILSSSCVMKKPTHNFKWQSTAAQYTVCI